MIRQTLWYATAYTIVVIVHEGSHALAAHALGLDATLYQFWANVDAASRATIAERAAYGIAGPLSSLVLGLTAWFGYRVAGRSAAAMPLLYLAAHGVANFCGNVMSVAFLGDFSNVATWTHLPIAARHAFGAIGLTMLCAVLFVAGRELARWAPARGGRAGGAFLAVVPPVAIGTALIVLVSYPVPLEGFAVARVGEGGFWIFALAGASFAGRTAREDATLRWPDVAIAIAVAGIVRLMARGIALS